jgi:glycosyltransferase involved in cell wall biosynthesis
MDSTNSQSPPLVSVVTPFHNTAAYLVECIESVLAQKSVNLEYLLVNNNSTDGSREIAEKYASRDPRIRLIDNEVFVGQIENYNGALDQISPASRYVKIVQADDRILPDCLRQMVDVAERDPHIGLVSSYYMMGDVVSGRDIPFRTWRVSGREICREMLLSGRFYLGSPTTVMYRADIVRSRRPFYALGRYHEDTEAAYEILLTHDFGFVHDVLSFMRVEDESLTGATRRFNGDPLDRLICIERYGKSVLTQIEYGELVSREWASYADFLGSSALRRHDKALWKYHRAGLATIGHTLRRRDVRFYAFRHLLYLARQPFRTGLKRLARGVLAILKGRDAVLHLRSGEWVEVRSREEILRTLDKHGRLDGLPFMPQMFQYCGTRLRVFKRAHKTCDTIHGTGGREMRQAVHLHDVRCDGQSYAGCGAACLIFWKDAWLKRVEDARPVESSVSRTDASDLCSEDDVRAATRAADWTERDPTYSCQATELGRATRPLAWWNVCQYLEDYESGNVSLGELAGGVAYVCSRTLINSLRNRHRSRALLLRWYDRIQQWRGGVPFPRRQGVIPPGERTPLVQLGLAPGECAKLKTYTQVLETLDTQNKNRGLYFDAEEVPYCGGVYSVRSRVDHIIDERTGRSIPIKSGGAVILDGVWCKGWYSEHRMFCPRAIFPFFRETWLERQPAGDGPHADGTSTAVSGTRR